MRTFTCQETQIHEDLNEVTGSFRVIYVTKSTFIRSQDRSKSFSERELRDRVFNINA